MEAIELRIKKVMSQLPPEVDRFALNGVDYHSLSDGNHYIQNSPNIVEKVQKEFLDICYEVTGNKIYLSKDVNRNGIIGRYLSDSNEMLYRYWNRFMCIDDKYREWGQVYFCISLPEKNKAESICLNLELPELRNYFITHLRDEKITNILDEPYND